MCNMGVRGMDFAMKRLLTVAHLVAWSLIFSAPAFSQATLLPNAKQTFLDQNGNPLSAGQVFMDVPSTQVPKTTWQDPGQTTPNTNPVVLDAAGRAVIYGQGNYQQVVKDSAGNQQWSALTTAYGSSVPSGATGTDTAPLGTVMPWAGFSLPTNWLYAFGQPLSRSTYTLLEAAITIQDSAVLCTASSNALSGFASTAQMAVGEPIEASCITSGTTIASITSSTSITASNNASVSVTTSTVVFPWGNGDGTSTFNVPDLRGRAFAGADAMGGTAASRLTSTFYGTSAAAPAQAGGSQSTALSATNQLPQFTPSGTVAIAGTVSTPTITTYQLGMGSGSGITFAATAYTSTATTSVAVSSGLNIATSSQPTWTQGATTFSGAAIGSGSPSAFRTIQPTLTVNYIIKALPNSTGAGGVVSLGGMFGDIVCGAGLTCAPVLGVNTVSVTPSLLTVPNGGTGGTSFTLNLPILGNGTSALSQGTVSGNTTQFVTGSGVKTNGHYVQWDVNGNAIDGGSACCTSGTVAAAAQNSIAVYTSAGTVAAVAGVTALPNGTTATTQSVADNSTKVATDAFVLANAATLSGNNAWTGNETHSGTETFNNAAGIAIGTTANFRVVNGVAGIRSASTTHTTTLDLVPNGSPSDAGNGLSWGDICNADLAANPSAAVQCLHIDSGSADVHINAETFSGGTPGKLCFGNSGAGLCQFFINPSGNLFATSLTSDLGAPVFASLCYGNTVPQGIVYGTASGGLCTVSSSEKIKQAILVIWYGLISVMKLHPVSYYLLPGHGDTEHELFGFTAEHMAQDFPALARFDSNHSPVGIDMMGTVPLLVSAVQTLSYFFLASWFVFGFAIWRLRRRTSYAGV